MPEGREADVETGAMRGFQCCPDSAAVVFYQLKRNGQPEPRAFTARCVEWIENAVQLFRSHSGAAVFDGQNPISAIAITQGGMAKKQTS
jgi:hypothetical protein